jgi:hypothetical protein
MSVEDPPAAAMAATDVHAYCREVEAYLCRRNDGHLIRIVGPSFELVKGWAEQGIPLALVREAIDRVVERAERKPQVRRRPLRIEFCDAEVLDGYDRWRRAVGVAHATPVPEGGAVAKRGSLHAHVERVVVQLAAALGSDRAPAALQPAVKTALTALDAVQSSSATARGAARDALIATLAEIDRTLLDAAVLALPTERLAALTAEATQELAAFRGRLQPAQWEAAVSAARGRLVRAAVGVPVVSFD